MRGGGADGRQEMLTGKYLYSLMVPLMGAVVVMNILDFFAGLEFRSILSQVLVELVTGIVDSFIVAVVDQVFAIVQ
jgi:uncharacterized membrane protein YeaQ/YmgE (transglycosylase-associated protein family)